VIGNRHAIAGGYIAAAALGVAAVAVLLALAAREIDRARRRELDERKAAFAEIEQLEHNRDLWERTSVQLAVRLNELGVEHLREPQPS
jgi:hypothetical protein